MANKSIPPDEFGELRHILLKMEDKISSARVLNGGFDKLEKQVNEIKDMQIKLNVDFETHKVNDARIEEKIDRLYDPDQGIYAKVNKTEVMLKALAKNVDNLAQKDQELSKHINDLDDTGRTMVTKFATLEKVTGDDHSNLRSTIKLSKGFWAVLVFAVTGLAGAVGKILWDSFIGG